MKSAEFSRWLLTTVEKVNQHEQFPECKTSTVLFIDRSCLVVAMARL